MDMQFEYFDLNIFLPLAADRGKLSAALHGLTSFTRLKHGLSCSRRSITRAVDDVKKANIQISVWLESRGV